MWEWMKKHPVLSWLMVLSVVGGGIAGALFLPEEWGLMRRILGGLMSGVGVGIILLGSRMLGAFGETDWDEPRDVDPPKR